MNPNIRPGGGPTTHAGQVLARRLPPLMARLRGPTLDQLAKRLAEASPSGSLPEPSATDDDAPTRVGQPGAVVSQLADLLTSEGLRLLEQRRDAERTRNGFLKAVRRAPDTLALQALLRHHLRTTRGGADLRRDLRALKRWLDADALVERMDAGIEALGIELELVCKALEGLPLREQGIGLLRTLLADPRLPTRRAAVACLTSWVVDRIRVGGLAAVPSELLRQLLQIARQRQGDPLTARQALRVLLVVAPEEQEAMLLERLTPAEQRAAEEGHVVLAAWARDDFLVRAEAARISQQAPASLARRAASLARRDPSETVRCALADGLSGRNDISSVTELERMAREDPALTVRLHARARLGERRGEGDPRDIPDPATSTLPRAGAGAGRGDALEAELANLAREAARIPLGASRSLGLPDEADPVDLARALLPWAEHDHGFSMQPRRGGRVTVYRGVAPLPRLWRMIHELRHPGPAKRQVGDHITGGTMRGAIRVPPARMAEVSATGVPNQRVFSSAWGSWAPWLPQPEDYLDALGHGSTVLVSREGVTTIQSPHGWVRRAINAFWFTWSMSGLDLQRQHALAATDHHERYRYIGRLARHGYTTHFEGHDDQPQVYAGLFQYFEAPEHEPDADPVPGADGRGIRVLGVGAPLVWESLRSLVGVRHNLPSELAAVVVGLAVIFFGRLSWYLHRTRRARKRIPLVMGGWGTRGKSGTERLKAAVFHGLGYDAICKTTGCEAVLLHAPPGGRAAELFLYRPYERATIWEHADTLDLASRLGSPVFLWECMALRPDYVEQLQLWWTRDDLSTITNTYPDHEDVQGPTGLHVAETIASFVPRGSLLLSTEQQMLPVLRDHCAKRGTQLLALTEEHVSSLPADLLSRIPYQEHPANVALVAGTAEALGLSAEEAIIMMADHVVPDLGALATYGPMRHLGRVVEMTNGMSANERAGFLNNWQRSGFATWDAETQADTFLVTVVNNRRDRVPRSRIFAEILANDAPAHRHVLIGTNLEGLRSYLAEALGQRLERLDPFAGGRAGVAERLDTMASFLRIVDPGAMLRATASSLGLPPAQVTQVANLLDSAIAAAPAEPMGLAEAHERLAHLRPHLESLAGRAGGVFDLLEHPSSATVHPRLDAPLFHDSQDYHEGVRAQAQLWLDLAAEALAFAALRRACMGQQAGIELPPPPPPVVHPAQDDEVTELLDAATAEEAMFWAETDEDEVIAALPAEDTDPGLGEPMGRDPSELLSAVDELFGGPPTEELPAQVQVQEVPEPRALLARGAQAGPVEPERQRELRKAARALFRAIFQAHLVVLPSPEASGDQVIDVVARSCPAGATVRVMGIQNIKGTGLDFVYRWVHSAQPLRWSEDLFHPDRSVQLASLSRLERWREWSIPTCQEVLRALAAMQADATTSQARSSVRDMISLELERRRGQLEIRERVFSLGSWLRDLVWLFWDPMDALYRRWRSDRIWQDLASGRISHARAARELARVAQRQRVEDSAAEPSLLP
jgi:poly-gamma-glutamate synthase PgsB/CapB